jgi:TonB family protein
MRNITKKIVACLLLAVIGDACFASKEGTSSSEALISRARIQRDIWAEGAPPMLMRAEIQISDAKGVIAQGQYVFRWVSPTQWTEEIKFANYERLRVRDERGYWQKSTLNYQPEMIFQLDRLLHFKDVLHIGPKETLGEAKNHDKDGVGQSCTEIKWAIGTERIMCFDEASGNLVSVEYPKSGYLIAPDISRIEYTAFNSIGEKRVPFEIQAFKEHKTIASVKILELAKTTEDAPAQFNVPADSEFWVQCNDMRAAELVNRVSPRYPASARAHGEEGRVGFYAVIEADGTLSHLTIIQRASSELEAAAAEAIRQWRYKPAACGSVPIRVETSVSTDFRLQR